MLSDSSPLQVCLTPSDEGKRLDNVITRFARYAPRDAIYKAIRSGQVRLDGKRAKAYHRVHTGQMLRLPPRFHQCDSSIHISQQTVTAIVKRILICTEQLIGINKPAGLSVHAGGGQRYGIIEALRMHFQHDRYPELVHRIDRLTSGCLVLARNAKSLRQLQQLWRQRKVTKYYLALVYGSIAQEKTVDLPLLAVENNGRKRVLVQHAKGATAITNIQKLADIRVDNVPLSVVQCVPHTGRMHQIRVHCQSIGHPIVGDPLYQNKYQHQWSNTHFSASMCLHAQKLIFWYLGEQYIIQSPHPLWLPMNNEYKHS